MLVRTLRDPVRVKTTSKSTPVLSETQCTHKEDATHSLRATMLLPQKQLTPAAFPDL